MNFFGMKKDKEEVKQQQTNFSVEELDELILEEQGEIKEKEKAAQEISQEIAVENKIYEEKLAALNKKQETFNKNIEKKNLKTAKELEKLELAQKEYQVTHEEQLAEINEKIAKRQSFLSVIVFLSELFKFQAAVTDQIDIDHKQQTEQDHEESVPAIS